MTDQKIIDRIKKLLELTTSPNEAEALLAMERAKQLMLKHSLNETDYLNTSEVPEIIQEIYSTPYFQKPGVKEAFPRIISVIAPIFGCQGFTKLSGNFRTYHLLGFKANIEITKFALDSLLAQGSIDARIQYRKFRTVTFGLSFWAGFADGLKNKFGPSGKENDEVGIILYDKVLDHLKSITNGAFYGENHSGVARESGFKSGMDASIRSGLTTSNSGKLLG